MPRAAHVRTRERGADTCAPAPVPPFARAPALKDAARRAEAVALLQRMVALDNPDPQRRACVGLGAMGTDAKPALETLKALTNHAHSPLKQAATEAVAKIAVSSGQP